MLSHKCDLFGVKGSHLFMSYLLYDLHKTFICIKLSTHLFTFLGVPMILGHIPRNVACGWCLVRKSIDGGGMEYSR